MAAPTLAITVLVIDDEPQIRRAVRRALAPFSAEVLEAATGATGVDIAAAAQPDMIIFDLRLPDMSGLDLCREIRRWSRVPLIVLSAQRAERAKVALLNAGADDYITKPFGKDELAARVRAHLRRVHSDCAPWAGQIVTIAGLTIDLSARTVARTGVPVQLTRIEWALLQTFVANRGRTLTHRQLFEAVWRRESDQAPLYLRVHITNLRRKIESNSASPALIITESGIGYRLAGDPTSSSAR